jgi:creatinine deaminase
MDTDPGFQAALLEAKEGLAQGGIPIGACLVAADGRILGRGHNMRVQKGSPIIHVRCNPNFICIVSCRKQGAG